MGRKSLLVKSQATGWRQQLNQRAASSAAASHSEWHATPGITQPGNKTVSWDGTVTWCAVNQQPLGQTVYGL